MLREHKPAVSFNLETGEINISPRVWTAAACIILTGLFVGGAGDSIFASLIPQSIQVTAPQIRNAVNEAVRPIQEAVNYHTRQEFPAHPNGIPVIRSMNESLDRLSMEMENAKELNAANIEEVNKKFDNFAIEQRRTNDKLDQLIWATHALRRGSEQ